MQKSVRFTLSAVALAAAAACAPGSDIVAPTAVFSGPVAELVGDRNDNYGIIPGAVNVCVFFAGSNDSNMPTGVFSSTATTGSVLGNFSIKPYPSCIEVWNVDGQTPATVTVSLAAAVPGWEVERIFKVVSGGPELWLYGVSSAEADVNDVVGATFWFKLKVSNVPPPQGGQGCTPGYWRQQQHFDSWTSPYAPTTLFDDVFANAFPGKTLLDVVWMGGGGVNALGRHAVAALLNGASGDVSYDLSTAAVISAFNTAYASGSKNVMNDQKGIFEMLNEQGCPLN